GGEIARSRAAKNRHQQLDVSRRRRFVERNGYCAWPKRAQITSHLLSVLDKRAARFDLHRDRIEEIFVSDGATKSVQTICQMTREAKNSFGDWAQPVRAMTYRVHRCDYSA